MQARLAVPPSQSIHYAVPGGDHMPMAGVRTTWQQLMVIVSRARDR